MILQMRVSTKKKTKTTRTSQRRRTIPSPPSSSVSNHHHGGGHNSFFSQQPQQHNSNSADSFPSSRTVEELKDRYYGVSRALVIARALSSGDVAGHPRVKDQYNASQETERKRALSLLLSHTKQQERNDVEVLAHAKRITEARKTLKAAAEPQFPALPDIRPLSADKTTDTIAPSTNSQLTPSTTLVSKLHRS